MRRTIAAVVLAFLSGCSAGFAIENEYSRQKATYVPISAPNTRIKELSVRFHPTDSRRAAVAAGYGDMMSEAFISGRDQWLANLADFREIYSQALLQELKKHDRDCSIVKADPFPDWYLFDFRYTCAGD